MRYSHLFATVLALVIVCAAHDARAQSAPAMKSWPRIAVSGGDTVVVYQPQLASWDYTTLLATSAVAIKAPGAKQETYGTLHFKGSTHVDRAAREVAFESLEITKAEFPSAPAMASDYLAKIRALIPKELATISLDRLEAGLAVLGAKHSGQSQPLKNDPPVIVFSTTAAILVPVDGPPVFRGVEHTSVERAVNTRALLLREKGTLYLHLFDGYVQSVSLGGPWKVAKSVSVDIAAAEKQAVAAQQVDLLAGQENPDTHAKPSLQSASATVPVIYVTTVPTELIVTTGLPQWAPIDSTQLLYVANTGAYVFKHTGDQKLYVLISGRWFRSASITGPWAYLAPAALPADFARIPDDSPVENAKASVPGTRQAQEAMIANDIPQTERVDRKSTPTPAPAIDGAPQLAPISGTSLHYVVNSATPIIQAGASSWFACQDGVWYTGASANGPWAVAVTVPAAIYSIPPGSPTYYVTYVRVYPSDASSVWVSTTPGYYGTVATPDGVVVFGTGYAYPAYIGPTVYVAYPITYGYGSNPCWTPWAGWSFGFAAGWAMAADWAWWAACPPAPFWGPYWGPIYHAHYDAAGGITAWGPYGWAGTSGYVYSHHGSWSSVSHGAAGYDTWTGDQWASKYGRAYNSTTGTSVVGQRSAVHNVYTGNYAYGEKGAAHNATTGVTATGSKVTAGNARTGTQVSAGMGTIYDPTTGNVTHIAGIKGDDGGVVDVNGHVIAGDNGRYYRPDGNGGWQERQPNLSGMTQWQPYTGDPRTLNQQYGAQLVGAERQNSFQAHQPQFGGGGRRR